LTNAEVELCCNETRLGVTMVRWVWPEWELGAIFDLIRSLLVALGSCTFSSRGPCECGLEVLLVCSLFGNSVCRGSYKALFCWYKRTSVEVCGNIYQEDKWRRKRLEGRYISLTIASCEGVGRWFPVAGAQLNLPLEIQQKKTWVRRISR